MLISKKEVVAMKITNDNSDDNLVRQIQAKSVDRAHAEISILYERYKKDVYRMTRSLFSWTAEGRESAEDLFAEAWTVALEKIHTYKLGNENTFGAWVKGIAGFIHFDDVRDRKRLKKSGEELSYLSVQGSEEKYNETDFRDEDEVDFISESGHIYREALTTALKRLSEAERIILLEWHRTFDKQNPGSPAHAANLQSLAERFGIDSDSVRKCKIRSEKKIKVFLGLVKK